MPDYKGNSGYFCSPQNNYTVREGVYIGKRNKKTVGKAITYWILAAFLTANLQAFSSDSDDHRNFEIVWEAPASIATPEGDIKKVLMHEHALHFEAYGFLPVYPIHFPDKALDSVTLIVNRSVDVREDELGMIEFNELSHAPLVRAKTQYSGGQTGTGVWVLPFYIDSLSGKIRKLQAFTLDYTEKSDDSYRESIYRKTDIFESVLSSGQWYKIAVTEDGVYRIDYDFLVALGVEPSTIDPRNIRIFGNGGYMLPQENNAEVPDDLMENSVIVAGENDGQFNPEDYILFYGLSPHKLKLEQDTDEIYVDYLNNLYSDTTYYFLNLSGTPGLRIATREDLGSSYPLIETFDQLLKYELDQLNILNSGREWYGEKYDLKTVYDYFFDTPGLSANTEVKIISSVMAGAYNPTYFELDVNGFIVGRQEMDMIPDTRYGVKGKMKTDTFTISTSIFPDNTDQLALKMEYVKSGINDFSAGYLDYLNIWCMRDLAVYEDQTHFQSVESLENQYSTFSIVENGEGFKIWDITDPFHPYEQLSDSDNGFTRFGTETVDLKQFVIFSETNLLTPYPAGKVANQDLHGRVTPEFIIIAYPEFTLAAERLENHRIQRGMTTEVVTTEQIYNEFSSGSQDVSAIRNFIKYRYDNGAGSNTLKHVLLLGRGSYDYKDRIENNTNFVPIYESRNSLHPIYSYSSDDYYAFMDDGEGTWEESFLGDHIMDITVGRIPVISSFEATDVINKIILYESDPRSYGPWRNDIYFVADDGDGTDGIRHSSDAEKLSVMVDTAYSNFNIGKIYVDAFPQIIEPGYQESPEARKAVDDAIKSGALLMNFTGHGNEFQWTSERILDNSMVTRWENLYQLPFFVTATCEYGRHDDPGLRSGAEFGMINKRGGVIGLVTTSRPVFASTNYILNRAFYTQVFSKVEGKYQTIGEIFKNTKNESLNGSVNRNFSLLGDPSMKLAYPEQNIVIDRINEIPIDTELDTLKALNNVRVSGKITDPGQFHLTSFNGVLTAEVYDKVEQVETLGTEDPVMQYDIRDNLIFKGDVTVTSGNFEFQFVVSKNIDYEIGEGKISLYAVNENEDLDAAGSNIDIPIGDISEDFIPDDLPPEIEMYLEDTTFVEGDLTSDHPRLIAHLFDESGINITQSELSEGIVATMDDEVNYSLNKFYTADIDDYRSGTVAYQFTELEEGPHYLVLRVYDTHNNMAEGYLEFVVGESHELVIKNLLNYPNPFRDETTFSFEHNRSGEDLEVTIQIYSVNGNLVRVIEGETVNSEFRVNDIIWDGRGGSGKKLETGIYIYRVYVRSLVDGAKNEDFEKLVIIN